MKSGSFPEFNFEIKATFDSPGIHILMLPGRSIANTSSKTSRDYLRYNSDISIHEISIFEVSITTYFKFKNPFY